MQHLEGSRTPVLYIGRTVFNPLNAELNPICHLLALRRARHILHISRIRVKGYPFKRRVKSHMLFTSINNPSKSTFSF
jgi:hypothetical protein